LASKFHDRGGIAMSEDNKRDLLVRKKATPQEGRLPIHNLRKKKFLGKVTPKLKYFYGGTTEEVRR